MNAPRSRRFSKTPAGAPSGWARTTTSPRQNVALGSTKKQWPLAKGFDRFYGFIGGETSQWYPDLIADNHPVEQPCLPKKDWGNDEEEEGYHLSKDLADQAIQMIKDQQASNPSKPWYMWFCPGANHAPHQVPKEAIEPYRGKFDDGYEAYRERVWRKMIGKSGILPGNTQLTDLNPLEGMTNTDSDGKPYNIANEGDLVRPWGELNVAQRKLFSKLMEVYAAFSTYTDAQVGRIVDYLEKTGQLDNTLIIYAADNGASGEGSPDGSVNENKFFNGYPDELVENMKLINKLGSPDTYEHYPTGWAAATSTPFKMFKRYSEYAGGTCDPLVMSWPARIEAKGEIRHQYHHATDIVPTILEACGLEMPAVYKGVPQYPLSGVSMCYTWDAKPDAPTKKLRQYYAMLGTRGIWEDGWKAACLHAPLSGKGNFENDKWELYHVDEDRSESTDLADKHPEMLQHLIRVWFDEAEKNMVLPLDDRSAMEQANIVRPTEEGPQPFYTYYPGTAAVPESVAVSIRGRSYTIEAKVKIESTECSGVIFAHGSRFGGHSLFIGKDDKKLYYVYNFLGIEQQEFVSPDALALVPDKEYTFVVKFTRKGAAGPTSEPPGYGESLGDTELYVNPDVNKDPVAQGPMKAQVGKFTLCGDGLCVGYDSADAVSKRYSDLPNPSNPFTGGTIHEVVITPIGTPEVSPILLAGAFAAD